MKFKVGDRVKFVKSIIYHTKDVKLGEFYTIQEIYGEDYRVECGEWFKEEELKSPVYTYEDLKKSPIGTKITFEEGNTLVKTCKRKFENEEDVSKIAELTDFSDECYGKIIKIEEPEYKTVYEAKPEILNEAEKRYLRGVIRPFKDKVKCIEKCKSVIHKDDSYICIQMENNISTALPYFESKTMYKGMELNKNYSLEELGL